MPDNLIIGLVSISDRASAGVYQDKGLPGLNEWLGSGIEIALDRAHEADS